jgi:hypothetical protein
MDTDYKIEPGVTEYDGFQLLKATDMKPPSPADIALANNPPSAEEVAKAKALVRYAGPA